MKLSGRLIIGVASAFAVHPRWMEAHVGEENDSKADEASQKTPDRQADGTANGA